MITIVDTTNDTTQSRINVPRNAYYSFAYDGYLYVL
jgi:hypothetical protein